MSSRGTGSRGSPRVLQGTVEMHSYPSAGSCALWWQRPGQADFPLRLKEGGRKQVRWWAAASCSGGEGRPETARTAGASPGPMGSWREFQAAQSLSRAASGRSSRVTHLLGLGPPGRARWARLGHPEAGISRLPGKWPTDIQPYFLGALD